VRILFSSTRGVGHARPLLPYARALRERGHEILVAGPADLVETLARAQLPHALVDHPGDVGLTPLWTRLRAATVEERSDFIVRHIFAGVVAQTALPRLRETIQAFRPDVIVRESFEFASAVAADAAGIPHARVAVHSGAAEAPTRAAAAEALAPLRAGAGLPGDDGGWQRAEPVFTWFPPSLDGLAGIDGEQAPFHVRTEVDVPAGAAAPAWDRADDRTPLVYVTFGTVASTMQDARAIYRVALEAMADAPVRALLTTGPGLERDALGPIPGNVHVEAWVPQGEALARARAVICHGGSGTVIGALAVARPLVVVPLFADQPENARRVAALGAGIELPAPTPGALREAIARVIHDADLQAGAARLAAEIAGLRPLDAAVDALLELGRGVAPRIAPGVAQ